MTPARYSGTLARDHALIRQFVPADGMLLPHVTQAIRRYFVGVDRPLRGVDIGAGSGETSLYALIAHTGLELILLDPSSELLNQARQVFAATPNAHFVCATAEEYLPSLERDSLDLIVSGWTLHNLPADERQQVLANSFRALRPGGLFVNADKYLGSRSETKRAWDAQQIRYATMLAFGYDETYEAILAHEREDMEPPYRMTESDGKRALRRAGFYGVQTVARCERNAVIAAEKPLHSGFFLPMPF